jgi:hypothetical protein
LPVEEALPEEIPNSDATKSSKRKKERAVGVSFYSTRGAADELRTERVFIYIIHPPSH